MKRKWLLPAGSAVGLAVLAILTALIVRSCHRGGSNGRFQTAAVTRGDIENTVSSTGTIESVVTIDVRTQVSGVISRIDADFNDHVRRGQVLALLDTIPLYTQVLDAEARLEQDMAQLEQARLNYDRNTPLYEKGLISQEEYLPFKFNLQVQQAVVKSSRAALTRAKQNLDYAVIRSPIQGTVIQRAVEVGQTVAASFNTPTLFIIAQDLSKMEINALVDESDIGQIATGQKARFTVEAYPDRTFEGLVRQVRLQPTTVQNVVNYTVIVDVENRDRLLLPGMTTTLDFVVEERRQVLLVPSGALKFQPPEDVLKAAFERMRRHPAGPRDSTRGPSGFPAGGPRPGFGFGTMPGRGSGFPSGAAGGFAMPADRGTVWVSDEKGRLTMEFVQTGATDGKNTEIVRSRGLAEGTLVVTGLVQKDKPAAATQSGSRQRGFGGGPPPRMF
jgi:HlyD family secretion protein